MYITVEPPVSDHPKCQDKVVAHDSFQEILGFDLETFGIHLLENWSLRRGSRMRQVIANGCSTVISVKFPNRVSGCRLEVVSN